MKKKVAELIAAKLAAHGCRHVFAISGAGNLHLFDAIARQEGLRYICPHHEQAGAMAAVKTAAAQKRRRRDRAMSNAVGMGFLRMIDYDEFILKS